MTEPTYDFYKRLAQTLNSGQSRSILLHGNVGDLFWINNGNGAARHVPLVTFLQQKWFSVKSVIQVTVELNGPLSFYMPDTTPEKAMARVQEVWRMWKFRLDPGMGEDGANKEFLENMKNSASQPAYALEFLRQVCMAYRWFRYSKGVPERLLIFVESAEMVVPAGNGDIAQLQPLDRRKLSVLEDWFGDPDFYENQDSVIMISQSTSEVHPRITRMPQVQEIEIPAPNAEQRAFFIEWKWHDLAYKAEHAYETDKGPPWNIESIAKNTAGLSLQALRQLLIESAYRFPDQDVPSDLIIERVEQYIKSQLGEETVEFKKPEHTLKDVVGFRGLKQFTRDKIIPRIKKGGKSCYSAIGVAGPIGVGKTFIFEALGNELDMPVIVLKNIRSKWLGETDVIFERLRRVLESLGSCLVFVDEADTQFGGLGKDVHETEKRLTGKIQAMMSDTRLRGRVIWLLMTARIEMLSPDMRRRGRAGDLIIPVLDPKPGTDDFKDFVWWMLSAVNGGDPINTVLGDDFNKVAQAMEGRSAGDFASIRADAIAEDVKDIPGLLAIIDDTLDSDIGKTRRYQELQALMNYTRKSLLPDIKNPRNDRHDWKIEADKLKAYEGCG